VITGLTLIGFFLFARWLVSSKFGRVLQAIRDAETRVMFTGYDRCATSSRSGSSRRWMCGIAGALYVPQVGIINPGEMSPAASIEIAIWAAVGGRGTLIARSSARFCQRAKSWFTQPSRSFWPLLSGALFIAVTIFLPQGIIGLVRRKRKSHDARTDGRGRACQGESTRSACAGQDRVRWPRGQLRRVATGDSIHARRDPLPR